MHALQYALALVSLVFCGESASLHDLFLHYFFCACAAPQVFLGNLDTTAILVRVIVGVARLNLARFTPVGMVYRWIAA